MSETDHASWRPAANPWVIALVATMAPFMEILDSTIVNVSLPHIAGSMSVSSDDATWTLTSYLVANGIVLPISGWLQDRFGRRRYFLTCIAMFTLCSFMCGIAGSLWQLIMFRLAQGFFGGGLQPCQQSILLDTFPPAQRGKAFGVTAIAVVVAPVMGPTLGGWITDNFSWRWVFLINVPIGILAFMASTLYIEDPPWAKARRRVIDYVGLSLIVLGFGCLQVFLDRGEDLDWFGSNFIRLFASLAFIGLAGAIVWLFYTDHPIVNLRLLKDRNFGLGCCMMGCMALMLYASAVMIPQMSQLVLGYTATWAGLVLSPGAVAMIAFIPLVGQLMGRVQVRFLVAVGFATLGASMYLAHFWPPDVDFFTLMGVRCVQTVGLAFLFVPISTLAYMTMPKEQNADGAALYTMFRNVAGSIGISCVTALVTSRQATHMTYMAQHLTPLDSGYAADLPNFINGMKSVGQPVSAVAGYIYKQLQTQSVMQGYNDVFLYCAVAALAMVPLCWFYSPSRAHGARVESH